MRAKELQTSTLEKQDILQFEIHLAAATNKATITGKSLSEALIFASTNPQDDNRLCIELQGQYMKVPSSNLGRTYCVHCF